MSSLQSHSVMARRAGAGGRFPRAIAPRSAANHRACLAAAAAPRPRPLPAPRPAPLQLPQGPGQGRGALLPQGQEVLRRHRGAAGGAGPLHGPAGLLPGPGGWVVVGGWAHSAGLLLAPGGWVGWWAGGLLAIAALHQVGGWDSGLVRGGGGRLPASGALAGRAAVQRRRPLSMPGRQLRRGVPGATHAAAALPHRWACRR